jgi:hypothetical protein
VELHNIDGIQLQETMGEGRRRIEALETLMKDWNLPFDTIGNSRGLLTGRRKRIPLLNSSLS